MKKSLRMEPNLGVETSLYKLLVIFILTLVSFLGHSQDLRDKEAVVAFFEAKVDRIVKTYDTASVVVVNITFASSENVSLPATPFVIKGTSIGELNLRLRSLDVTVLVSKTLPNDVQNLIKTSLESYGVKPKVEFKTLPNGFLEPSPPIDYQKIVAGLVSDWWNKAENTGVMAVLVCGVFLVTIILMGIIAAFIGRGRLKTLERSVASLVTAINDSSGGGGRDYTPVQSIDSKGGAQGSLASSESKGEKEDSRYLNSLSSEGLNALIMDCYWCEEDGYASYVWNQLDLKNREECLSGPKTINLYIDYLSQMPSENKNLGSDPYYLKPLKLDQTSNADLAEVIKDNPALLNAISQMRLQKLPLKATERIEIRKEAEDATLDTVPNFESSSQRELRKKSLRLFVRIFQLMAILSITSKIIITKPMVT